MPTTIPLPNGDTIPQFGFGTYKITPDAAERAVSDALTCGYRHIDTATMYGNEREVGRALAASGLPRDQVFVTTKLNNTDHTPASVRPALERSLDALGLDTVDLYLIHWPMARSTNLAERWRAMTELVEAGLTRNVGVSNYTEEHLRTIIDGTGITPAVNQVEINPYLSQEPLRAAHRELGIVTEAWSPLARGRALTDPAIERAATEAGCTPSQLVLAWHLHRGDIVFPKSTHPDRMRENFAAQNVTLTADAIATLDSLNRNERSGSAPDAMEADTNR